MAQPFLSEHHIARSDLIRLSFDMREAGMGVDEASSLVGWAMEEFAMQRCAYLAAAVCLLAGREHFVGFMRPDGRLVHAVVALSPQFSLPLAGNGADILGRRPLKQIEEEVSALTGPLTVEIGSIPDDLEPDEAEAMAAFAACLPWFGGLAGRRPLSEISTAATAIGFRKELGFGHSRLPGSGQPTERVVDFG